MTTHAEELERCRRQNPRSHEMDRMLAVFDEVAREMR